MVTDKRKLFIKRTFLERVSGSGVTHYLPWQDKKALYLPSSLSCFNDIEQNKMLYFFLVALMVRIDLESGTYIQKNIKATKYLIDQYSGFKEFYTYAIDQLLYSRTGLRSGVCEDLLLDFLKTQNSDKIESLDIEQIYPFELWIYPPLNHKIKTGIEDDQEEPQRTDKKDESVETLKMKKESEQIDDKKDSDGLLMFLPESILSILEQVNVDRSEDDSFDEDAIYNAEDLDEITLGRKKANLNARIKMDLDIKNTASEEYPLGKGHLIDEWDYAKGSYLKNFVCIKPIVDINTTPIPVPQKIKKMLKQIKNELDMLQLDRVKRDNLPYGDEIDFDKWIEHKTHHNRAHTKENFYNSFERKSRDMSTLILADISLSTEAGITQDIRIIDTIQESLMVFAESLQSLKDSFSIYAFSSLKNTNVRFHIIKNFKEPYSDLVRGRIAQMKPGYYTRLGAAIRESTNILRKQQHKNRLLLILSDGKPNDLDKYDGRYGIEDTKKAVQEAIKLGITPFCITIDLEAKEYLSYIFGKNGFTLVRDSKKLPKILPKIYINLTARS